MPDLDIAHELWRLEGRTFATDGHRVIACNDGGCLGIARGDDPGTALAIAHVLEIFFKDRQQKAAAKTVVNQTLASNPRFTPGMIDFMRACVSKYPPVHCPCSIIGGALADMGMAYFEKTYKEGTKEGRYWPYSGQWRLTGAGLAALSDGGEAVHAPDEREGSRDEPKNDFPNPTKEA